MIEHSVCSFVASIHFSEQVPTGEIDMSCVKIVLLDNEKPVFIITDGMVDTAINSLGARLVDVTE